MNTSALSWSVANVCSLRPSLPSASQHQSDAPTAWCASTSSIARRARASLSAAIVRVNGSDVTPCASRLWARLRMSSAQRFNAAVECASVNPSSTCRIDARVSVKRSRSLTTPTRRLPSTTTICRTSRAAIVSIASCAVAAAGNVTTGVDITSASGVVSGLPPSTTRRSRSTSVNMPIGAPPDPTTTIVRTRASLIFARAVASGSSPGQVTGSRRTSPDSGRAIDCCSAARCV